MSKSRNNRKRENSNNSTMKKLISAYYLYKDVVVDVQTDADLFHQALVELASRDNGYYLREEFHDLFISELEAIIRKSVNGLELTNEEKVMFCLNVYALSKLNKIPQNNSNGIVLNY